MLQLRFCRCAVLDASLSSVHWGRSDAVRWRNLSAGDYRFLQHPTDLRRSECSTTLRESKVLSTVTELLRFAWFVISLYHHDAGDADEKT